MRSSVLIWSINKIRVSPKISFPRVDCRSTFRRDRFDTFLGQLQYMLDQARMAMETLRVGVVADGRVVKFGSSDLRRKSGAGFRVAGHRPPSIASSIRLAATGLGLGWLTPTNLNSSFVRGRCSLPPTDTTRKTRNISQMSFQTSYHRAVDSFFAQVYSKLTKFG